MTILPIAEIHVAKRGRNHLGDVRSLAESIRRVGLLHPVVVDGKGNLIAGKRRLEASRLLGWTTVPVTVVTSLDEALDKLLAERDENVEREPFKPTEIAALAAALEPLERNEAKKREAEGQISGGKIAGRGRPKQEGVESTPSNGRTAKSRDKLAAAAGVSHPKLKQIREVVEAARQDPKTYGDLPEQMDRTGNVNRTYRELRRRRAEVDLETASQAITEARSQSLDNVCDLRVGSCRDLFASGIRPDAVITDPPYPREFLSCFSELAEACKDVPLVAVMSGQSYLPEVMHRLCEHLTYRWTLAYMTPGGQAVQQWSAKVNTFWKPVLLFGEATEWIGDVAKSDPNDNDKRFHDWGQSESGMADLVGRLTKPGQTVCDPFLGGGTTAVVALALGRLFVGCDVDPDTVNAARIRIAACSK